MELPNHISVRGLSRGKILLALRWFAISWFSSVFLNEAIALEVNTVSRLIKLAEPSMRNPEKWSKDILSIMARHHFNRSKRNVCSVIAVIDQESGFIANPRVSQLGKITLKEVKKRIRNDIKYRLLFSVDPSARTQFFSGIKRSRTERDLDLAYRKLVGRYLEIYGIPTILEFTSLEQTLAKFVEKKNGVQTIGSMQVSVRFALKNTTARKAKTINDIYRMRNFLYTRRGGLYYGILQLLGYRADYSNRIFLFADYNAGRYSSRNAAFQKIVSQLSGIRLKLDGDLLLYDDNGHARSAGSKTEKTINTLAHRFRLKLSSYQIRRDLLLEKRNVFVRTRTFLQIRRVYRQKYKNKRKVPYAIVPQISLKSIKIRRRMTTAIFAKSVYYRYLRCMRHQ